MDATTEYLSDYPAESCTRIEVATTDGLRLTAQISHPKGHYRNPLTDGELEAKFRALAAAALGPERCERVLAEAWGLENTATLDGLFESLIVARSSEASLGPDRQKAPVSGS